MAKRATQAASKFRVATKPTQEEIRNRVNRVATKEKPSTGKKQTIEFIDDQDAKLREAVRKMICLLVMADEVDSTTKAHQDEAKKLLFEKWTTKVWDEGSIPPNAHVALRKPGTNIVDMSVMFQVNHRADGIKLPDELPEGRDAKDQIIADLISPVVGLSSSQAVDLVENELTVHTKAYTPDLYAMSEDDDPVVRSAADKTLRFLMAVPGEEASLELLTEAEQAQIIRTKQIVILKDDFLERSFTYCDTVDQLRKLLVGYLRYVLKTSHAQFGESDTPSEKNARKQAIYAEFFGGQPARAKA